MAQTKIERAEETLEGLTTGDAFGDMLSPNQDKAAKILAERSLPSRPAPWRWTDDSNMAFSIVAVLRKYGEINQDALAQSFATRYDVTRGYGPSVHRRLRAIREDGQTWQIATHAEYPSYGNGGAMRVAPLGAYFADDIKKVIEQATLSCEVTHAHPEGIAGGIAVAVATAYAYQLRGQNVPDRRTFLDMILPHVPDGEVSEKIRHARNLAPGASIQLAASALGDGRFITAQDTVPFVLWCAGEMLSESYEEAIWFTLSKSRDRDTNCAMVGGIVTAYAGLDAIPVMWREKREAYPQWFLDGEL
ncbi:MAG: ADP-ribosylglycohydrolase family protein [Aggregatilineales bacterium]